jgi:hypothetical protein
MALLVENHGDGLQVLLQCTHFDVAAVDEAQLPHDRVHIASDQSMPTIAELQAKLDDVRQEVRNLTVMAMNPRYAAEAARIREMERSARAKVKLRILTLEYWKRQQQSTAPAGMLMTPAEHMAIAESARDSGRSSLAQQFVNLAKLARAKPPKR